MEGGHIRVPAPKATRITDAGKEACKQFFDSIKITCADQLPSREALERIPEYLRLVTEHKLNRGQVKTQHTAWKLYTSQGAELQSKIGDVELKQSLRARVEARGLGALLTQVVNKVHAHRVFKDANWDAGSMVNELIGGPGQPYWIRRIDEVISDMVEAFPSTHTQVNHAEITFTGRVDRSRRLNMITFMQEQFVTTAFSKSREAAFNKSGTRVPRIFEWPQFKNFVFWLLDDLTVKELRWSFSDAAHHKLTIPVEVDGFGDSHFPVITNKLVLQTLYYISGYLLKAMSKHAEQSSNGVGKKACLLAFVRNNETTCAEAEKDVLPVRLVKVRSSGDLRYSSKELFDLICGVEHAYSSLLTMTNVVVLGANLVAKVSELVENDSNIDALFQRCTAGMRDENTEFTIEVCRTGLKFILMKYLKLRGKDFVKSLLSCVKAVSMQTLSTRAWCAAMAKIGRENQAKAMAASSSASESGPVAGSDGPSAVPAQSVAGSSSSSSMSAAQVDDSPIIDSNETDDLYVLDLELDEATESEPSDDAALGSEGAGILTDAPVLTGTIADLRPTDRARKLSTRHTQSITPQTLSMDDDGTSEKGATRHKRSRPAGGKVTPATTPRGGGKSAKTKKKKKKG